MERKNAEKKVTYFLLFLSFIFTSQVPFGLP